MTRLKLTIMKKNIFTSLFFILAVFALNSCKQSYSPGDNLETVPETKITIDEIDALMDFLDNSGDYINSYGMPNMVSASNVYENLNRYFILDIRSSEEYVKGHINGAMNISTDKVLNYLDEFVAASVYDKIIVVDETGQAASFVTAVLRMLGYNNAYAMKYGMGAWNRSLDKWSKNTSSKFSNQLESKDNPKTKTYALPKLTTGQHCGAEIMEARATTVLNTPFERLTISAERVYNEPEDFYIINYWTKDRYDYGHIPGSHQYTPKQDIKKSTLLNTIPDDKKIVIYGYTGQTSSFLMAYLRMLGYNAFVIPYGANSFMYNQLLAKNWNAFKADEKLNDYLLIKGEKPMGKDFNRQILKLDNKKSGTKRKIIKRKKKEVEGGCS
jgi:rhodanese-related sulfurtransferase